VLKWQAVNGYDGDRTWSISPAGGTATMTLTDVRGRTTQLRQYTAGVPPSATTYQTTSYGYDQLGHPTTITDPDSNQWTTSYDLRGRPR
jgi:YD repeat-containing protein